MVAFGYLLRVLALLLWLLYILYENKSLFSFMNNGFILGILKKIKKCSRYLGGLSYLRKYHQFHDVHDGMVGAHDGHTHYDEHDGQSLFNMAMHTSTLYHGPVWPTHYRYCRMSHHSPARCTVDDLDARVRVVKDWCGCHSVGMADYLLNHAI